MAGSTEMLHDDRPARRQGPYPLRCCTPGDAPLHCGLSSPSRCARCAACPKPRACALCTQPGCHPAKCVAVPASSGQRCRQAARHASARQQKATAARTQERNGRKLQKEATGHAELQKAKAADFRVAECVRSGVCRCGNDLPHLPSHKLELQLQSELQRPGRPDLVQGY